MTLLPTDISFKIGPRRPKSWPGGKPGRRPGRRPRRRPGEDYQDYPEEDYDFSGGSSEDYRRSRDHPRRSSDYPWSREYPDYNRSPQRRPGSREPSHGFHGPHGPHGFPGSIGGSHRFTGSQGSHASHRRRERPFRRG